MSRALAPRVTDPEEPNIRSLLPTWQQEAKDAIAQMFRQCWEDQKAISDVIGSWVVPRGDEAVKRLAGLAAKALRIPEEDAERMAVEAMRPPIEAAGLFSTTPFHWSYDAQSLWRGKSDNAKACRLARGILLNGFIQSEVVNARTVVINATPSRVLAEPALQFRDGQARVQGAFLAWTIMENVFALSEWHPSVEADFKALIAIPTHYDKDVANAGPQEMLIQQAVRQNVRAQMTVKLNVLEWTRLALFLDSPRLMQDLLDPSCQNHRAQVGKRLDGRFAQVLQGYNDNHEITSFDEVTTVTFKERRSKGGKPGQPTKTGTGIDDSKEDAVRLGQVKVHANSRTLMVGTAAGVRQMQLHLVWAGSWQYSALSDVVLAGNLLWPGSPTPLDCQPSAIDDVAMDAGGKGHGAPCAQRPEDCDRRL